MATSLAPRTSSSSSAPALESAAFYSILLLLVFGPLAFGAVEEWSSFALKAGAVVAAMFWAAAQAVRREVRIRPSGVYVPMLILTFGFFLIVIGDTVVGDLINISDQNTAELLEELVETFGFMLVIIAVIKS